MLKQKLLQQFCRTADAMTLPCGPCAPSQSHDAAPARPKT